MSTFPFPCTLAAFAAQRDVIFTVTGCDGVMLTLVEAVGLDQQAPDERRFSLMFRGPAHAPLQQGTYTLEHSATGALAIFLVPVGRAADGIHYQAIFN